MFSAEKKSPRQTKQYNVRGFMLYGTGVVKRIDYFYSAF
jgi:hypothetical protein